MKSKRCLFSALKVVAKGLIFLVLAASLSNPALTQSSSNQQNSGPFKFENGVRKARFLIVNFKNKIFNLPQGKKTAEVNDMQKTYGSIRRHFEQLEARYGKLNFHKQIPDAVWGDVLRQNRKTGKLVQLHEWSQYFYVVFPDFVLIDSLMATMKELPEVDYVRAPVIAVPQVTPIDPEFNSPTGQWNLVKVDAKNAWNISRGSSDVIVAVIEAAGGAETGIPFFANPDFWTGDGGTSGTSKFAPGGHTGAAGPHATGVAGIVAAATDDTDGIASLGWDIRMRPYKFDESRLPDFGNVGLAAAIELAIAEGTDVINFSFVLETFETRPPVPCTGCLFRRLVNCGDMPDTEAAIEDAKGMGIIMVAAAGNNINNWVVSGGTNCAPCLELGAQGAYPALNDYVSAITATDSNDDAVTDFNFGNFIDFAAPGMVVRTTVGNAIENFSGTSFASPLVASLAGLVKSINPMITQADFKNILITTSEDVNQAQYPGKDVYLGYGRINAYEALKYTLENYGGTLSGDVLLTEDLTIASGKTLTIEDGTTIEFDSGVQLTINGVLNVNGLSVSKVTFTRSGGTGNWDGIRFNTGSSGNVNHAIIEYVSNGDGINIQSASPTIENTTISNCLWGLNLNTSNAVIENCIIDNNDEGVFDRYGAAQYLDNTIKNSFGTLTDGNGLNFNNADPMLFRNVIEDNDTGVYGSNAAFAQFGAPA